MSVGLLFTRVYLSAQYGSSPPSTHAAFDSIPRFTWSGSPSGLRGNPLPSRWWLFSFDRRPKNSSPPGNCSIPPSRANTGNRSLSDASMTPKSWRATDPHCKARVSFSRADTGTARMRPFTGQRGQRLPAICRQM